MAIEVVKEYFTKFGIEDRIQEFKVSSATVELAAKALNVSEGKIAKTLSFKSGDAGILIVCAGDVKIDNSKFKNKFGMKAKMLTPDEVINLVGHAIGGVCPFGINKNISVYLDESMKRFNTVFPACGSDSSAIELHVKSFSNTQMQWNGLMFVKFENDIFSKILL